MSFIMLNFLLFVVLVITSTRGWFIGSRCEVSEQLTRLLAALDVLQRGILSANLYDSNSFFISIILSPSLSFLGDI